MDNLLVIRTISTVLSVILFGYATIRYRKTSYFILQLQSFILLIIRYFLVTGEVDAGQYDIYLTISTLLILLVAIFILYENHLTMNKLYKWRDELSQIRTNLFKWYSLRVSMRGILV